MIKLNLAQLIPQEICLRCDICCRFSEQFSAWAPFILKEELSRFRSQRILPEFLESYGINISAVKKNGNYACPFFLSERNCCRIYPMRPFDCQIYPFVIAYNNKRCKITLSEDSQCPFIAKRNNRQAIDKYAGILRDILETKRMSELIYENKGLIMPYSKNLHRVFVLERITRRIFMTDPELKAISLKDKETFQSFFEFTPSDKIHSLRKTKQLYYPIPAGAIGGGSKTKLFSYAFAYIYSWIDTAHIIWKVVDENLVVFWKQKDDCFLLIPPFGERLSPLAIEYSLELYKKYGLKNTPLVIENADDENAEALRKMGFAIRQTNNEYICATESLASLRGDRFKSQRSAYNYFKKHFSAKIRRFESKDVPECLDLYASWARNRLNRYRDKYYRFLIEDSFYFQRRAMLNFTLLGLSGIVLELEGKIAGYSFGYPIDRENFSILAEVSELGCKGISEYIAREFCHDLFRFKFLNLMDDSGLENLKKTKLSYHPEKINPIYTCQLHP